MTVLNVVFAWRIFPCGGLAESLYINNKVLLLQHNLFKEILQRNRMLPVNFLKQTSTHPSVLLYVSTHPSVLLFVSTHPSVLMYVSTHPSVLLYVSTHPSVLLYVSTYIVQVYAQ